MSRMKLVLQVTEDVQALADSLRELAEAMQSGEPEPTQGPKTEPEPQVEEVKQPTLEEVRLVGTEIPRGEISRSQSAYREVWC